MKRYHQEQERTRREHRFHLSWVHKWPESPVDCELQAGRFRKKKALDCGKPRCLVCSFDKVFGIPSHKDRLRQFLFKDSLADYYDGLNDVDDCAMK